MLKRKVESFTKSENSAEISVVGKELCRRARGLFAVIVTHFRADMHARLTQFSKAFYSV